MSKERNSGKEGKKAPSRTPEEKRLMKEEKRKNRWK
jgi:hypothetical protein